VFRRAHESNTRTATGLLGIGLGLSVLLSACAGRVMPYSPGADLLVQAALERALISERIAYKRNLEGEYLALNAADQSRLVALGEEAQKLEAGRETLSLSSDCATDRVRAYLRRSGAIFAVDDSPGGSVLLMTAGDFAALEVAERYREFVSACDEQPD